MQAVGLVELQLAFENQVVNLRIAVLAPVAATGTGVKQGTTQTIVVGAAGEQVGAGLEAIVAGRGAGLGLETGFDRWLIRDRPGHEVDDTADVLWPVTYCAAAPYDIDGIHVAHADRSERQLWLTVRREGYWNAVHQYGGARRQAWVEATNAEVQCHVMAAGAVVFRGVDPGNTVEHFTGGSGTLAFERFTANHITGARVFEDIVLLGHTQPVPDHGRSTQLQRGMGGCLRLQTEGVFTLRTGLQAATLEQNVQRLLWAELAIQTWALHAAGDLGAKRDQHAAFPAELIQGVFQQHRSNVIGARGGVFGQGGNGDSAQACTEQQGAKGLGEWARARRHARGP
ncbi:hypothetical protein D3C81_486990 [compost metagenome]